MRRFPVRYCITGYRTIFVRKKESENRHQSMNMKTKIHVKKTRRPRQLVAAVSILVTLLMIPVSAQTEQRLDSLGQEEANRCTNGITSFDAPGAGTGAFQGTYAYNIA